MARNPITENFVPYDLAPDYPGTLLSVEIANQYSLDESISRYQHSDFMPMEI